MKSIIILITLMFIIFSPQSSAYERVVLAEMFTSTTCPPCAPANNFFDNWLRNYANRDRVAVIKYHVWWPSPGNDPYYHANPLPVQTRNSYYGNNVAPRAFFDGATDGGSSYGTWSTIVQNRMNVASQLLIEVNGNMGQNGGTINIKVTADGNDVPAGTLILHTVVVESDLKYTGTNNDPVHHHVMRQMYPDRNGETFDLRANETRYFTRNINWNQNWERKNSEFVIFVQVRETKQILQAVKRPVAIISPAPALITPEFGVINLAPNVEFNWGAINKSLLSYSDIKPPLMITETSSITYHLQVAKDENFTQIVFNDSTIAGTNYMVENLESFTKYYWRVRSKTDGDISPWSFVWHFTTGLSLPNQVNLIMPQHQSILPYDTVHFAWNKGTPLVSNYWFEYADNEQMNNSVVDSTLTDTTISLISFEGYKEYWWRVRAKNEVGWGSFSESRSFTLIVTGTEQEIIPEKFALYQNYPNPFNPVTRIKFSIPAGIEASSKTSLKVYDMLGNEVVTLINEHKSPGIYEIEFSTGSFGDVSNLSSGIYFYILRSGEFISSRKMVLMK